MHAIMHGTPLSSPYTSMLDPAYILPARGTHLPSSACATMHGTHCPYLHAPPCMGLAAKATVEEYWATSSKDEVLSSIKDVRTRGANMSQASVMM